MLKKNIVFIAKSLDGYIADKNGGLDWLHTIPNPDKDDMDYNKLMTRSDALVCRFKKTQRILTIFANTIFGVVFNEAVVAISG